MKLTKSTKRTPATKGSRPKSVDEYMAAVQEPAHDMLQKMRTTIRSVVPKDSVEVISYGIPAFKHKKVLVWYAAFSSHCSLFPTAAALEELKDELKGYTLAKGTIQFPLDKPLPTALVKKLVKARVAQIGTAEKH